MRRVPWLQVRVAQWCARRREVHRYSLPSDGAAGHSVPHSVTHPQSAGWQTVLRVYSGPASPSGVRTAVTSVDVHVASGGGGALLAFARADGPVGVVDMRPDGEAPTLLWCREVHKRAIGAAAPALALRSTAAAVPDHCAEPSDVLQAMLAAVCRLCEVCCGGGRGAAVPDALAAHEPPAGRAQRAHGAAAAVRHKGLRGARAGAAHRRGPRRQVDGAKGGRDVSIADAAAGGRLAGAGAAPWAQ